MHKGRAVRRIMNWSPGYRIENQSLLDKPDNGQGIVQASLDLIACYEATRPISTILLIMIIEWKLKFIG